MVNDVCIYIMNCNNYDYWTKFGVISSTFDNDKKNKIK